MAIYRTVALFAASAALLACAAPAFAQDPVEAPDPELQEPVDIGILSEEASTLYTCMGIDYDEDADSEDEPLEESDEDLAAREAACTDVIETGARWPRETAFGVRAQIRWQDERKEEALADYTALVRLAPRNAFYRQARASLYSDMKQYDKANEDLMVALKQAPMNPAFHNSMCWMLAMQGEDLPRALNYCNISIGLSPAYAAVRDSRAMVHFKMGKFAEALADYERAMNIEPASAHYMYGRGLALLRLGQKDEGRKWLDRATAADAEIAKTYADYGVKP